MSAEHERLERKWIISEHGTRCPFMADWCKRLFLRRLVAIRHEVDRKFELPDDVRVNRLPESANSDGDPRGKAM